MYYIWIVMCEYKIYYIYIKINPYHLSIVELHRCGNQCHAISTCHVDSLIQCDEHLRQI